MSSNGKRARDDSSSDESHSPKKKPTVDVATSYPKSRIRILLLEGIHQNAVDMLKAEGFVVDFRKEALEEDELVEAIKSCHAVGIRSKTKLTRRVLEAGKKLLCTGSFCIGTDGIDLDFAAGLGIPCFNAPFSNTRSVAELVIAQMINLARRVAEVSSELHNGVWNKSASSCYEVRGKTVGIVGYGHVGSQVSVLSESLGMNVIFYDASAKMGLGNATATSSLHELLQRADFVTLHVPLAPDTTNMIQEAELRLMKPGSYLINYSRGTVVNVDDLAKVLREGHLAGAAVDVFPEEPAANGKGFVSPLQGCPNTVLTPHIGGSTQEAQALIGSEVAAKIISLINTGCTEGAVNFPNLRFPKIAPSTHCVINVHKNVPGVLSSINGVLREYNVTVQLLDTRGEVGYMLIGVEKAVSRAIVRKMREMDENIRTRVLF